MLDELCEIAGEGLVLWYDPPSGRFEAQESGEFEAWKGWRDAWGEGGDAEDESAVR